MSDALHPLLDNGAKEIALIPKRGREYFAVATGLHHGKPCVDIRLVVREPGGQLSSKDYGLLFSAAMLPQVLDALAQSLRELGGMRP